MTRWLVFGCCGSLLCTGFVFAQDIPDQNPVPNSDGTYTWYTGNNTQYPRTQDVIDACSDGDQIVITHGDYVESLRIDRQDLTVRSATRFGADDANDGWQLVVFWNPTEGNDDNNGYAIWCGSNTSNTYIGRPREIKELANGDIVPSQVPLGGPGRWEWTANATYVDICNTAYTNLASQSKLQQGLLRAPMRNLGMRFWSRSIDDVAIRCENSAATFSYCNIRSHDGFGGGVMIIGDEDRTAFVNCEVCYTYSGGQQSDGYPVHAISIHGGNPMFAGCWICDNMGGFNGLIYQNGGASTWTGCRFGAGPGSGAPSNQSPASNGIFVIEGGGHPTFLSCSFERNLARFGTIYFDSTENADSEHVLFSNCIFDNNLTVDDQWGAVMTCVDAVPGRNPLCVFDRCIWDNPRSDGGTQSSETAYESDVRSNYFPRYRILRDVSTGGIHADTQGAGVANANEFSAEDINRDGVIDGQDLALLLGSWG